MTSEASSQEQIIIAASRRGDALWRNNSGACLDQDGRMIRYGLGNVSKRFNEVWKSPDLIGITQLTIRAEHVGRTFGIFTGVECKSPSWRYSSNPREKAQMACLSDFTGHGGIAMFARSVEDYHNGIDAFIR